MLYVQTYHVFILYFIYKYTTKFDPLISYYSSWYLCNQWLRHTKHKVDECFKVNDRSKYCHPSTRIYNNYKKFHNNTYIVSKYTRKMWKNKLLWVMIAMFRVYWIFVIIDESFLLLLMIELYKLLSLYFILKPANRSSLDWSCSRCDFGLIMVRNHWSYDFGNWYHNHISKQWVPLTGWGCEPTVPHFFSFIFCF